MTKKVTTGLVLFMVLFGLALNSAVAKDKDDDYSWGKKIFKKMYLAIEYQDQLGLNDSQVNKIMELKTMVKKDYIMEKAEIETIEIDLKMALMSDAININKVNSLIDKKYQAKSEKAKLLIKAYVDFKGMLSEQQAQQLKAMYEDKKCGSGYMMHKGAKEMKYKKYRRDKGYMMNPEQMRRMYKQ
jgi:hypothetical protein